MESPSGGRCVQVGENLLIIIITLAQLIFFTWFHRFIAWSTTGPDGTVTRHSMLTDSYFTWLPIMITASIIVILTCMVMIVYHTYQFHQVAWIGFCVLGIAVTVSLVTIFPFDFSVLPSAKTANAVSKAVRAFFIFMPVFYALTAVVQFVQLRRHLANQGKG